MKRIAVLILILLSFENAFSLFATVNNWNTRVFKDEKSFDVIGVLPPCTVVSTLRKVEGERIEIFYDGKKGWVERKNLTIYYNIFSNFEPKPKFITNAGNDYFFYYFKESINKFNLYDKKIEKKYKVGKIQQILPSPIEGVFLFEGVVTNNGEEIYNLSIYDINTGKNVYIGSFERKTITIENTTFLNNPQFVAVHFKVNGKKLLCVYNAKDGRIIAHTTDALGVFYLENTLFFYNLKNIWTNGINRENINADFSQERHFISLQKKFFINNSLNYLIKEHFLYIETIEGVFAINLKNKSVSKTPYKSLITDENFRLCYYEVANRQFIKDIENNIIYSLPDDTKFFGFSGTNVIISRKYGKVETFFLISLTGSEIYRYRSIDRIDFINRNEVVVECNFEKNLCNIIIEDPGKTNFHPFFIKVL